MEYIDKMQRKFIYFVIFILIISIISNVFLFISNNKLKTINNNAGLYIKDFERVSGIGELDSTHIHAHLKIYVNNKALDLSISNYQSKNKFVHLEDGIGELIHVHATRITLEQFLYTLKINPNENCITVDKEYCNDGKNKLLYFINNQQTTKINYIIKDHDKILITYGDYNNEEMKKQLESVNNLQLEYLKVKTNNKFKS